MSEKLIPVDRERCQTQIYSAFQFGPGGVRCSHPTAWVATEPERADGKKRGSMGLCACCRPKCEKKMPGVTFRRVRRKEECPK